jgi:DNA-binding response OmpR family regulator
MLQARYIILEAENQRDALKLVKESRPNLVILNFHLPRVNIGRLCGRIREEAAEEYQTNGALPIILVVESPDTINKTEIVSIGADDRIYKPLPVSIVEKRVKDLLDRRQSWENSLPASSPP